MKLKRSEMGQLNVYRKMFLSVFLSFVWICSGSKSTFHPKIECTVMNLEYINCTWDGDGNLAENYTFKSRYEQKNGSVDCSSYQYVGDLRVGCVLPYDETRLQRFNSFQAWLYRDDTIISKQEYDKMTTRVKLAAPYNVTVMLMDPELWFYWNITNKVKLQCQEREVRYTINGKTSSSGTSMENAFNVPFPNAQSRYEFQVRVRMFVTCGQSDLWSEWSEPVVWGSMKKTNDTAELKQQMPVFLVLLYTVGAVVLLIILTYLLIHCERLRVILVPVVPSPKYLNDLIESYDGNVEKWLHISKELQDGFKPNFSERPCAVREFRTEAHSESESDDALSVHTDISSDYQSMQSYSSTSTLPSAPDSPSTEATPLNRQ